MARRATRPSNTHRRGRSGKGSSGSGSKILMICGAVCILALIGFGIWKLVSPPDYIFQRKHLDKYVEVSQETNLLKDGASIYVDMSDGMNRAYATAESKALLQSVINRLAGNGAIKFFGLADEKITPMEGKSHTELYNYMLNPASYNKQKAPIEETLKKIVEKQQPALIMSDFEEYNGGVIQKAAYAKENFIKWLAMGNNISFYKWKFVEQGKNKNMYIAVFDDNANRLNSLIESAIKQTDPNIATFVLGSREFAYPTFSQYPSLKQGGNYHNSKGVDAVSAIMENGGPEDYVSYSKPLASASGTPGTFAPLDNLIGVFAEYYPLGVTWKDAIANAKQMQESGVPEEEAYTHLLSHLFMDFGAQNGYKISGIEVRTFDVQESMKYIGGALDSGDEVVKDQLASIENPEINMILTATMNDIPGLPQGWKEILVDFDEKFNGNFMGGAPSTDLLKADIVISHASANVAEAEAFFNWEGNPSLYNSVKETLNAGSSSPVGRILYTYYIRTIAQ